MRSQSGGGWGGVGGWDKSQIKVRGVVRRRKGHCDGTEGAVST